MTLKNLKNYGKRANKQQFEYALTVFKTVEYSKEILFRVPNQPNLFLNAASVEYVLFEDKTTSKPIFVVKSLAGRIVETTEIICK